MAMPNIGQIPLDLSPHPDFTFEAFLVGKSNQDAVAALEAYPDWPSPILILLGGEGCGKTHLGVAWQSENTDTVFLDDAESLSEEDVFIAANQALNSEIPALLLASRRPPQDWGIDLPDLRSRLFNQPVAVLHEPEEDILEPIIRKLFVDKGRAIKADVVKYLVTYYDRSVPALRSFVSELDAAARAAKKDITRNFVSAYIRSKTE